MKVNVPARYLNRPECPYELQSFLDAFFILSVSRPLYPGGLGAKGQVGFIPLSEIESYCRLCSIQDTETMVRITRHMDSIYVKAQNDKLTSSDGSK